MLVEDVQSLVKRHKSLPPTEAEIDALKQDFSQSLTADAREIDKWLKTHPLKEYPYARLEWLENFHMVLGETDDLSEDGPSFSVPASMQANSWWDWYAWLRGAPPADFPSHLSWWVCLHRKYLTIR